MKIWRQFYHGFTTKFCGKFAVKYGVMAKDLWEKYSCFVQLSEQNSRNALVFSGNQWYS
jgi:hypothetical protein